MSKVPEKDRLVHSNIHGRRLFRKKLVADFIQDLGRHLKLSKKCIYSALVYMHKFFDFHGFEEILSDGVGVAALFLATKSEDEPRPLEHVIKVSHMYMHKGAPLLDVNSEVYIDKKDQVITLENILLRTLGFNLKVEPHALSQAIKQSAEKERSSNENLSISSNNKRKLSLNEYRRAKRAKVETSTVLPLSENVKKIPCVPSTESRVHKLSLNSHHDKKKFRTKSSALSKNFCKWRLIPLTLTPKKEAHKKRVLSIEDYWKQK